MMPEDITTLRSNLGISQQQLAELTGVHAMTVSRWERGVLDPATFQRHLIEAYEKAVATDKCHVVSIVEGTHKRLRKGHIMAAMGFLLSRGAETA